jgi:hypothetical protein
MIKQMNITTIIRIEATISSIGGIGLLVWWFLMPILLPIADAADYFQNLILDSNWVFVNVIGLCSVLLLTLGFPGFYLKYSNSFKLPGFIGMMVTTTGLILYTCIQYYETIIWPAAAKINPRLLDVQGELVSGDTLVVSGLVISGAILSVGYMIFGISALKAKSFPKLPIWMLIIGVPMFGIGVLFPIRTVGILLFSIGTICLANHIRKVN